MNACVAVIMRSVLEQDFSYAASRTLIVIRSGESTPRKRLMSFGQISSTSIDLGETY